MMPGDPRSAVSSGATGAGGMRRGNGPVSPAARLLRPLHIQLDYFRIWYKINYERGRILATRGDEWRSFDAKENFEQPERFYHSGDIVPRVTTSGAGWYSGAEVTRFSFPTLHPLPYPESNVAVGRFYRILEAADAPIVLISHGWAHKTLRTVEHLYVRPFLRRGFSVLFLAHPLHFERTPRGCYSGELLISGDVSLTVEAFRQGVIDLIGASNWLRSLGHRRLGLVGYSLGGYLAGIAAALRSDWTFVILGGTGDSIVSPILETSLGTNIREDLRACQMLDREKLTRSWRIISPGELKPRVTARRILLVAGRFDRIMLPAAVRRLWSAWQRPRLDWLNRGHYTLLATNGGFLARAIPFIRNLTD